ncbi:MAG: hypothetical protein ABSA12_06200 [Verrucomicrobiia bacterium]|jgi:hypothetical protein
MIPIRLLCQTILSALVLLLCSCSRCVVDQADINRDAASRCVQNIGAWKKDLAKLDRLEAKFDLISDQIRRDYPKAAPEEKVKLRAHLADVIQQTDQTSAEADALYREIIRDLEYVSRDKRARARIVMVTTPLRDAEGIRTPEIQYAMDVVSSQLQILLRVD